MEISFYVIYKINDARIISDVFVKLFYTYYHYQIFFNYITNY